MQTFLSLRGRADLTMLMLGIYIVLVGLIIVMQLNQNSYLADMSYLHVQNSLRAHAIVDFIYYMNFIAIVVTFLIWQYRASSNLRSLGVTNQRFTPRAGVIWWFVPVAWWWMPYLTMLDVWRGSLPEGTRVHPAFTLWWLLWLAGGMGGPVVAFLTNPDPYTDPDAYINRNLIEIPFYLLLMASAWFLFEIVRRTTKNQEQKVEPGVQHTSPATA